VTVQQFTIESVLFCTAEGVWRVGTLPNPGRPDVVSRTVLDIETYDDLKHGLRASN
jgi:hypothetical protein